MAGNLRHAVKILASLLRRAGVIAKDEKYFACYLFTEFKIHNFGVCTYIKPAIAS